MWLRAALVIGFFVLCVVVAIWGAFDRGLVRL